MRKAAMAGVSEMENANHAFEHHKFQAAICRRVPHRQGSVWRLGMRSLGIDFVLPSDAMETNFDNGAKLAREYHADASERC
jgi:hypothetical protein